MAEYEVKQFEVHTQATRVEASSRAEAIKKILRGEGTSVDSSMEYVEVDNTRSGIISTEDPELFAECEQLGVPIDDGRIPSIESVEEV